MYKELCCSPHLIRILLFIYMIIGWNLCLGSGTVSIKVPFKGGTNICTSCNVGTYGSDYACNDGRGDWNEGSAVFQDPIPNEGYALQSVTGFVYAGFACEDQSPPVVILVLQDAILTMFDLKTTSTSDCKCPNCVHGYNFSSGHQFPNYAYQRLNEMTFTVSDNAVFCVSHIELNLTYGYVNYNVTTLSPSEGGGNINITVFGNNFYPSDYLECVFGTTRVPAKLINSTALICTVPVAPASITHSYNVTVEVSEDGVLTTHNGVHYTYLGSKPPSSQMLWVWVAIGTCVASVLFVAIAGYFYAQRHKPKGDQSLIDENSRLINSEKYKQYGKVQPVDMSEIIIQQRIGRGSCAEVFMGSWRGTTVAIKKAKVFADDDEEFFMELSQEAAIMSELRHPNVLQFLGTASNPPEIVIIMEFMARGSLYRIIHDKTIDLPWPRIRNMALDVARGMNYLHCSDPIIIHRDLKSHNLLVDEHFKVKVCDFGLSTMVKRHLDKFTAMTPVGTPCWTAPEVLRNELYTERADVYSYGVVLWELVTREDPYQGMPTFQIVIAVGQHKMRPLIPPTATPALAQLMVECWNEDPNIRPSFAEIVQRLEKM